MTIFNTKPDLVDKDESVHILLQKGYGPMRVAYRTQGMGIVEFNTLWDEFLITTKDQSDDDIRKLLEQEFNIVKL